LDDIKAEIAQQDEAERKKKEEEEEKEKEYLRIQEEHQRYLTVERECLVAKIEVYRDSLNKITAELARAESVEKLADLEGKILAIEVKDEGEVVAADFRAELKEKIEEVV
jgi:hypothetical protein